MSKRVTIITVTYNSAGLLPRWIASVLAQTVTDYDVIIVDNASAPDQRPDPSRLPPGFRLIQNETNVGFAAANNQAVAETTTPLVAFLNPDAFPAPDWLERLLAAAEAHPSVAAFGSTQLDDADPTRLDGAGDVWHGAGIPYRGGFGQPVPNPLPTGECFAPCAAAALWRCEVFQALGGFEEGFFAYCEDVDLGFRLRLAGGRCLQVGEAVVRHMGSGITGRKSDFTMRLGVRNRFWTLVRCVPGWLLWVSLPMHALAVLVLWAKAARDGAGRGYGQGLAEGLAGLGTALKQRAAIQATRTVSVSTIAGAMSWSITDLLRRDPHLWPFKPGTPDAP